jgi:transcriptional regulator with XRE-family HTH domain
MTHQVDWDRIADAVEMACDIRGMTLRDVAEEVGISPSGLTRLRHGKQDDPSPRARRRSCG